MVCGKLKKNFVLIKINGKEGWCQQSNICSKSIKRFIFANLFSSVKTEGDISEDYRHLHYLKTHLWNRRFQNLKTKISQPWSLKDLEKVKKSLKNNRLRHPNGMINESFKPDICDLDLKAGVLKLMNNEKTSFRIPQFMQLADITSIYKNKGSRQDLNSDRGIFVLSVLRKVFDKLNYEDKYQDLEMSRWLENLIFLDLD